MNRRTAIVPGLIVAALVTVTSLTSFEAPARAQDPAVAPAHAAAGGGLAAIVREATVAYRDVSAALAAGYVPATPCVTGPAQGAMGFHYAKPELIGDGVLDARSPEILMYEQTASGELRLLGVEYVAIAEAWDAVHEGPATLEGHLFHFTGSPNRYRLPAFYALHVWAWKHNPKGTFVNWNPLVSCN